ncbi:MAG TPA: hypothetical protein DCO75_07565 [Fibrobacteres bacterium]|jgi:hypothetical protein|nr:hypothetical protein [Fibrobacterota bacterium]
MKIQETAYAIFHKQDGIYYSTISRIELDSIQQILCRGESWKEFKQAGYKCIPITITYDQEQNHEQERSDNRNIGKILAR